MKKIFLILLFAVSCLEAQPKVVVTTNIIASIVENVAGDAVEMEVLMPPGIDPHQYIPTYGDMRHLSSADIVFYNGMQLEGKMDEILVKMGRVKTVIPVTDGLDSQCLINLSGNSQKPYYDPHVWFDIKLWKRVVEKVCDTLSSFCPDQSNTFKAKTELYLNQLDELDNWCKQKVQQIPMEHRYLVTAHDAFNYFGRAYDIEVVGLQGITTTAEYGLHDLTNLVNLIVDNNIKAIFWENGVPPRSIESLQQAVVDKGYQVAIGGKLYSDSLGAKGTPQGTYVGMMKHNVNTIVEAIQ